MTVEQSEKSRLQALFSVCRGEHRAALIGYLPTGYPDVPTSIDAMKALTESGCDLIEVGVPYSDPGMDGPVIAEAAEVALRGGVRVRDTLAAVEAISAAGGRAVVMTYWNPVLRYGVDAFARDLAAAGGYGLITPDLIPDEADEWLAASEQHSSIASSWSRRHRPTSAWQTLSRRHADLSTRHRRWVLPVPAMWCPTPRPNWSAGSKRYPTSPVGVGLGVRSREQAAEIAGYADGVIVGSALVSALADGLPTMRALSEELAAGVRQGISTS